MNTLIPGAHSVPYRPQQLSTSECGGRQGRRSRRAQRALPFAPPALAGTIPGAIGDVLAHVSALTSNLAVIFTLNQNTMREGDISVYKWIIGLILAAVPVQAQPNRKALWLTHPAEAPEAARMVSHKLSAGQLVQARSQRDGQISGRTHERMDQHHQGVRVVGGQLVSHQDSGSVLSVTGNFYENIQLDTTPSLTESEAQDIALRGEDEGAFVVGSAELVVLPLEERFHLAYSFHVRSPGGLFAVYVDAHSGAIVLRYDDTRTQSVIGLGIGTWGDEKKISVEMSGGEYRAVDVLRPFNIRTYNVKFDFRAWARLRAQGHFYIAKDSDNEWRDGAVVDAHTYSGYTYDYYFKRHGRYGIDDLGTAAANFVHFIHAGPHRYADNAFYYFPDNSMNFGDGDGVNTTFYSSALDIVAHELTHGVVHFTSSLIYLNESGALNEAFCDIIGTSAEFFFQPPGNGRNMADWVAGEDIFINFGPYFRSFSDPSSAGSYYPDHYSKRYTGTLDRGGIHINSSIASHAFYLMVEGGTNRTSGIAVNGLGRSQMDRIESVFYRAFTLYLVPSSNFSDARRATLLAARELYGQGSPEERVVTAGWNAVGVQ